MNNIVVVPAKYAKTGVRRFDGNPFIEALPRFEQTKQKFLTNLSHYPEKPTAALRKSGEIVRIMELATLNDVVFPFPEYQKAGLALASMLRDTYVPRNPVSLIDKQRRYALATQNSDGAPFPLNWKSTAKGHFLMGISGMGKTTFSDSFLLRYPQVIVHTEYMGKPLHCHQVVYLVLRVPHDATLKSLCIQFFHEIDRLLNTNYVKQARSVRQVALMVQLMNQVATAVSLGLIVIDEVQNLRHARGGNEEFVMNLFSEIIEKLGISLLALGTPAIQPLLEKSVRNTRKLTSWGETILKPMRKDDPLWDEFCETYWEYSYVKKKGVLNQQVKNAWHDASGGNSAFAALAFALSQRNEIGGREIVDANAFARTAVNDMAFLQPAINALRSGKPERLRNFDDLLFSEKYQALRKLMGAKENSAGEVTDDEFVDVEHSNPVVSKKPRKAKKPVTIFDGALPMQDPLSL